MKAKPMPGVLAHFGDDRVWIFLAPAVLYNGGGKIAQSFHSD